MIKKKKRNGDEKSKTFDNSLVVFAKTFGCSLKKDLF